MSTSLLEIIQIEQGKVVLRRADGRGEPLIEVQFSPETQSYLNDICLDVAKVMIEAGIAAVANSSDAVEFIEGTHEDDDDDEQKTLH